MPKPPTLPPPADRHPQREHPYNAEHRLPFTRAGAEAARAVLACSDLGDLDPMIYTVVVDHDGDVSVLWGTGEDQTAVICQRESVAGVNLRGLLTAVKHGMIR